MIGGMITAPLLSVLVIPAAYYLIRRRGLARGRLAALGAGGAPLPQPQRKAP
jgi:Cu(I)/Ag(I) efflux system membrane protein CusA/SilA